LIDMSCFNFHRRINTAVPSPDYKSLRKMYKNLTFQEMQDIFQIFEGFCDENGKFRHEEFFQVPEMTFCKMLEVAINKDLLLENSTHLGFENFIKILNIFSKKASPFEKLQYLFHIMKSPIAALVYETDFTSFQNLLNASVLPDDYTNRMYKSMWANLMEITSINSHTVNVEERGLNFESFCNLVSQFDLLLLMTLDV